MRHYLIKDNLRLNYIENKVLEHEDKLTLLFNQFKTKNNHLFFEGQIYDAYSLLIEILSVTKEEIIIIDNYAGRELFDILRNVNVI